MATRLNTIERQIYNSVKSLACYKRINEFMNNTACIDGKTRRQQCKDNDEHLRKFAKLAVANPSVRLDRLFGWWFGLDGYRRPANLIFAV